MRFAYWDSADPAMVFDNPNLRWGSPAYLLEPGDPGYVPPANSVSEPKTKGKKMKRQTYYPTQQAKQVAWLYNLANKLPGQATALGLGSTQVAAIQADCLWLAFLIQTWLPEVRTWAQGCTQTLNEAQTGTGTAVQTLPAFAAPALPPAAPPLPAIAAKWTYTAIYRVNDEDVGQWSAPVSITVGG